MGSTAWNGVGTDIDKAVALRDVFTARQPLASAKPAVITDPLGKIRIEDARAYVAKVAPTVSRLLGEIGCALKPIWEREMRDQEERAITHMPSDLLWRDEMGWAVCLAETPAQSGQSIKVRLKGVEKNVMAGYYVNASEACNRSVVLSELVGELRRTIATTMSEAAK